MPFNKDIKFSENDKAEIKRISRVFLFDIDNKPQDYFDAAADEISRYQPFLLSLILGDRFDFTPDEVDELIKVYFLI